MRIGGIGAAVIGPYSRRPVTSQREPQTAESESRALIAVAPAAQAERSGTETRRPSAPFLAHLIATNIQVPQTRARRRAEPADAVAVYQGAVVSPVRPSLGKLA